MTRVAAGLREWTRSHDLHVRAAVWLLLAHETWPRRPEFLAACVRRSGTEVWIDWRAAREAFDAGEFVRASSTEIAVLDLVIALGEDRYRLRAMGDGNARLIAEAVAAAVGVTR
jgi:hypothetical protein